MSSLKIYFSFFLIVGFTQYANAQMEIRVGEPISCFHAEQRVHNDESFYNDLRNNAEGRTQDVENIFDVSYSGFTTEARAVFQKATEIWSVHLKSSVKIKVLAQWSVNANPFNLGFVTPTEVKNFDGAPLKDVWYPITLAEKLARKSLNGNAETDINANFNSGRSDWYLGLDGNPPANTYDLLTVILHELGHGLGISGTFYKDGVNGIYGTGGFPKIYDLFLVNGSGQYLTNTTLFPNNSAALGTQLTGNSVVFQSPIAVKLNSPNGVARIYSPNPYEPGSSISHLDQSYSPTINGLMSPYAEAQKVAHSPGPLTKGMLYEMGWLHTFIDHVPLPDQESMASTYFEMNVTSDTTVLPATATLHYSYNNFTSESTLTLPQTSPGVFKSLLAGVTTEKTISYFFTIKDVFNREYRYPLYSNQYFDFYYGVDQIKPVITHTPQTEIIEFEKNLVINATVTDNIGLDRVYVAYQVNEGTPVEADMTETSAGQYTVSIDLESLEINQGDQIKYRLHAIDNSSQSNETLFPAAQQAIVTVKVFASRELYTNNFNAATTDFFGDFSVKTITGFSNGAIHSTHPYPKASTVDGIDFIYNLLVPIDVKESESFIELDEVVLVEPGTGENFNDYAIIEGSSDGGDTWLAMTSKYDSRGQQAWLDYYNSNIQSGDSKAIGTLNYFKHRSINILNTFDGGDEIFIRFRLHSDNQKNGWGWAIDNLKIQDNVVAIGEFASSSIKVFPNPAFSDLYVKLEEPGNYKGTLMDVFGRQLNAATLDKPLNRFDVSTLSPGVYFMKIVKGDKSQMVRIIKH